MIPFPRSLDEITAEWFGQCLATEYPGTAVERLDRGTTISGTATKVHYRLDYNDRGIAHGLPQSLWLKCGLETQIPERSEERRVGKEC